MSPYFPLALSLLLLGLSESAWAQVLVAHPEVTQIRLAPNQARAYFYMRLRRWPDNTPLRVFVLPDAHPLHVAFTKNRLGVYPYNLRRAWDRVVFAGLSQAPQTVQSVEAMRQRVAETPGAIGYLPEEALDGRVRVLEFHEDR